MLCFTIFYRKYRALIQHQPLSQSQGESNSLNIARLLAKEQTLIENNGVTMVTDNTQWIKYTRWCKEGTNNGNMQADQLLYYIEPVCKCSKMLCYLHLIMPKLFKSKDTGAMKTIY